MKPVMSEGSTSGVNWMRRGQRGFAQARHVLDEHVARADQGNQQVIDDGILADDDLPDIAADIVQCV